MHKGLLFGKPIVSQSKPDPLSAFELQIAYSEPGFLEAVDFSKNPLFKKIDKKLVEKVKQSLLEGIVAKTEDIFGTKATSKEKDFLIKHSDVANIMKHHCDIDFSEQALIQNALPLIKFDSGLGIDIAESEFCEFKTGAAGWRSASQTNDLIIKYLLQGPAHVDYVLEKVLYQLDRKYELDVYQFDYQTQFELLNSVFDHLDLKPIDPVPFSKMTEWYWFKTKTKPNTANSIRYFMSDQEQHEKVVRKYIHAKLDHRSINAKSTRSFESVIGRPPQRMEQAEFNTKSLGLLLIHTATRCLIDNTRGTPEQVLQTVFQAKSWR